MAIATLLVNIVYNLCTGEGPSIQESQGLQEAPSIQEFQCLQEVPSIQESCLREVPSIQELQRLQEAPSIREFQCLRWNRNGRQERTRIMREVTPKWRVFGIALGFDMIELDTIELACLRDPEACIQKLFGQWALSKDSYSWNGMVEALNDCELDNLAAEVKEFLFSRR